MPRHNSQATDPLLLRKPSRLLTGKVRRSGTGGGRHAIWEFPIEINRNWKTPRLHTTQKPVPLMASLVADFTDIGETVLAPFMGSASTAVAGVKLGRRFHGIEKSEHYFDVACQRIADVYAQAICSPYKVQ